jgi:hypothetical protein
MNSSGTAGVGKSSCGIRGGEKGRLGGLRKGKQS